MYSISGYGSMIADKGRMNAYVKALRQSVKPDSIVIDIGTGTGIFAFLACQFGAKKVYAIEPGDAIEVAKEIAKKNGYGDRIIFIQDVSTKVKILELADVIVSDIRGILPLFQQHIPSIVDARNRLLAAGGILIPQRDTLWAAIVEVPHLYSRIVDVWEHNIYNLNMSAARQIVVNNWSKGWVAPAQLLTTPQTWGTLDYSTIESPDVSAELSWTVARSGTGYGVSIWFDAMLAEGVSFSTAPGMPELVYGNAFLPWLKPVFLEVGDTISLNLQANLVGNDYVWRWNSWVFHQGDSSQVKANFQQSTFFATPLSPLQLRKSSSAYLPSLNEDGEIDRLILKLMGEGIMLGDIASQVQEKFPTCFANWQDALTRVGNLAQRYSK